MAVDDSTICVSTGASALLSHDKVRVAGVASSTIQDDARSSNVMELRGGSVRHDELERCSDIGLSSDTGSISDIGLTSERELGEERSSIRDARVGVTVVLPVRDDATFLVEQIRKARALALDAVPMGGVLTEIVVINDARAEAAHEACQQLSEYIDVYERRGGEGWEAAVRQGIARALGEVILVMAPGTPGHEKEYTSVLQPILAGAADVVLATSLRQWCSRPGHGCAAFRVEVLEGVNSDPRDFEAGFPEELFDKRWRICELGVS